jgi:hypothetical protein
MMEAAVASGQHGAAVGERREVEWEISCTNFYRGHR